MKKPNKKFIETLSVVACDFAAITLAYLFALLLVNKRIAPDWQILYWYLANLAAVYVLFAAFRLYSFVFNAVGIVDCLKLTAASVLVFGVNCAFVFMFQRVASWGASIAFCIFLFLFALIIRFSKRLYYTVRYSFSRKNVGKVRTMIVGAGNAGAMLIREIQTTDKINYLPLLIVDDDLEKLGKTVHGIKVAGTTQDIPKLASKYAIDDIIIAIPAAPKAQVKRIYEICKNTKCSVKTLPGIYQIVSGEARVNDIRPVQITDLLGRDQITVNLD